MKVFKYILALSISFLLLFTEEAYAQGLTTATIEGTVTDASGLELIGATVMAKHEPTGANYGAVTNIEGRYILSNVRTGGPYTITVKYLGYNSYQLSDVNLQLGQKATFNFKLDEAQETLETVEVVAQTVQGFDPNQTGAATNVSTEQINSLPTLDRSLNDVARLTPQAIETEDDGVSFGGQNNRYNSIMIDGAIYNDVFGLNANGTPGGRTGAQPISLDAIKEVQILLSPYDVQQSGFTGAAINAITRGGTNELEGSAYYFVENEGLAGESLVLDEGDIAEPLEEFTERTYGFRLGGPIIKDKLFYFVNLEARDVNQPHFPNGLRLSEDEVLRQQQIDTLAEFTNILRNVYGYDPGGYGPGNSNQPRNRKVFFRLDYNLSDVHKISARYNFTDGFTNSIFRRQGSDYSFDNSEASISNTGHNIVAELQSNFGKGKSNEFRISYNSVFDEREPTNTDQDFPQVYYENPDFGDFGRLVVGSGRFDALNSLDQKSLELTNNFRFLKGNHSILLGTRNEFFYFKNLFIESGFGEWTFQNLTDLREGRPLDFRKFYSTDPNDFEKKAEWGSLQLGAYIQDDWSVNDDLKVSIGARIDVPFIIDEVSRNYTFEESFGRRNDLTPKNNPLFSPRLGFNYNLFENTVIRGGTGVFSGRIPFVWLSNQYSRSGVDFATSIINSPGELNEAFFDGLSQEERLEIIRNPRFIPSSGRNLNDRFEINLTNPNLRLPQEWRTTIGIDHKLPYGIVASLDYMYSETLYDLYYTNINLAEPVGQDDKGRNLYGTGPNNPYQIDDQNFTDVYVVENTTRGFQSSITGTLKKTGKNLFAQLSYTYAKGMSVGNNSNSIAGGNWSSVPTVQDPNNPGLAYSDFNVPHRIVGNLSYSINYWDDHARTTLGLYFNAQAGRRHSFVYNGDANFDTTFPRDFSDLLYVPNEVPDFAGPEFAPTANEGTEEYNDQLAAWQTEYDQALSLWVENELNDEILFSGDNNRKLTQWQQFNDLINGNEYLSSRRGKFAERNASYGQWFSRLDLTAKQRFSINYGDKKHGLEFSFIIRNFGNFLGNEVFDKPWGKQYFNPSTFTPLTVEGFDEVENDIVVSYRDPRIGNVNTFGSIWRMQFGVRYEF